MSTEKEQYHARFQEEVNSQDVVIYLKGTQKMPMCGFSATVVAIFQNLGVPFRDINIFSDPKIDQYLESFSQWPTYPQIFVKGELVGGCDIAREMLETGELQQLLEEKGISYNKAA